MPNYKPVKILFDIDDEHQRKLFEELKKRSNQSSYIRALIYQDTNKGYSIVKEQSEPVQKIEESNMSSFDTTESVSRIITNQSLRVKVNKVKVIEDEDEDIVLEGVI